MESELHLDGKSNWFKIKMYKELILFVDWPKPEFYAWEDNLQD